MTAQPMRWLKFLATVEPTTANPSRYAAGDVYHVPGEAAAQLIDAGVAVATAPPEGALREPTEPAEFPERAVRFLSRVPATGDLPAFAIGDEAFLPHQQAHDWICAGVCEPIGTVPDAPTDLDEE